MAHSLKEEIPPCVHRHRPIDDIRTMQGEREKSNRQHHHVLDSHRPKQRRALWLCMVITGLMMIVEFAAGLWTGSLMLISDSIHMLSHAAALAVSLLAVILARKDVGKQFPFGLYRLEILAAMLNGIGLAGFSIWIVYEGILRIINPVSVMGPALTFIALIGLAVNLVTAFILQKAGAEDLNTRSAFLHMLADTFSSLTIVAGGIVISLTNWVIIDPVLSIVVAFLVAKWSYGLLRDSTLILLEHKPDHLSFDEIQKAVRQEFPEVRHIHDLHIWEITSQFICMSAHIVVEDMKLSETDRIRSNVTEYFARHFGVAHVVIQVEC